MQEKAPYILVSRGEPSELKNALNMAVATLFIALESHFRPSVSLNSKEGVEVLQRVRADPWVADTQIEIRELLDMSDDQVWLNVRFELYLYNADQQTGSVTLSPRQTARVVQYLPEVFRNQVLERIRNWYFSYFLCCVQKGLSAISQQFEKGDLLADDYLDNRVFDIHSKRDVDYTECLVVGERLYWECLFPGTSTQYGADRYQKADSMIAAASAPRRTIVHQSTVAEDVLSMIRKMR